MNLREFELARFQHANAHRARVILGGSGVADLPADELRLGREPVEGSFASAGDQSPVQRAIAQARGVPDDHALPVEGGTEALFVALFTLVSPGDRVLVESPTYFPIAEIPRVLGARVQALPRSLDEDWRLDVDEAIRLLDDDVSVVALANPNNPSGRLTPAKDLIRLAEACEEVGAWLLVDDAFRALVQPRPQVSHKLHPRIVTAETLTKCHGLSGIRAGWVLAPPELRPRLMRAKGLTTIVNPGVTQAYVLEALRHEERLLARALRITHENHARWRGFASAHPDLAWRAPDSPLIAAVRLPRGVDDVKHCETLLDEEGVLLVPGTFLGLPGFVRVGFGAEPAKFADGLERWGRHLG